MKLKNIYFNSILPGQRSLKSTATGMRDCIEILYDPSAASIS
jgi:hypothetical protein